jgi:hypothetical protein
MDRAPDTRLTREVAREACLRVGSKALVAGSISSLGGHYVVGLQAINCQTREGVASEQAEADGRERILRALGDAATRLRTRLPDRRELQVFLHAGSSEPSLFRMMESLRTTTIGVCDTLAELG